MELRPTPTLTAAFLHLLHLLPHLRTCPITEYSVCVPLFTFSLLPDYFCCTASSTATFNTDQMVYLQRDLYRVCNLDEAVENDHWVSLGPLFTSSHLRRTLETPDYKGTSLFTENEAYERQLTGELFCHVDVWCCSFAPFSDREIVQSLLDAAESGHYLNNPRSHPAFDLSERGAAPACLHPFMDESSERIAFHRTGHLRGTPVGTALLLFNGTKGISIEEFAELWKRSHKCTSCYCYFSFDGYQRHIGYRGVCENSPDLETGMVFHFPHYSPSHWLAVPDLSTVLAKIKPFSIQPPPAGTTFVSRPAATNAVGLAWLTWNSHIGVTHDTWAQLITAWRRCDHCGNVRSFQGHISHLEEKTDRFWSCGDGGDDDWTSLAAQCWNSLMSNECLFLLFYNLLYLLKRSCCISLLLFLDPIVFTCPELSQSTGDMDNWSLNIYKHDFMLHCSNYAWFCLNLHDSSP